MRCADKVAYGSAMLASNARWLHLWAYPGCGGVDAFPCGDHWHIGHPSYAARMACHLVPRPPLHRPRHTPRRRVVS